MNPPAFRVIPKRASPVPFGIVLNKFAPFGPEESDKNCFRN